ncbi:hypothetical protein M569_11215, partial [Genlisea aurea]
VPTCEQISHLILEQKTANQALQTFEWASKIPGFIHTRSTYRALIHKLCTFRQFEVVDQLLDEMPKAIGSVPGDDIFITLVRGFGRAGMIREIIRMLETRFRESAPTLRLLNSILDVLVKVDIDIAREFYRKKMMGNGMKGDDYTYGILMKGFCQTNRIGDGFKLLQVMRSHGIKVSVVVYNTLIYALCKNGKVGRARSLMSKMEEFSGVTFDIFISAYCNDKKLVQALVMLEKCLSCGFFPNVVSVTKLVEILCNEGRVSEAVELLERLESGGGTVDVVLYNTLFRGFVKAREVRAGRGFLKQMEMKGCLPNTDTYNILIGGFCESNMLDSAMDMFQEMKQVGVGWNHVTFETLIYGLCSRGRTDDGIKILEIMLESNGMRCCYRIGSYNSILYGLYRENRLDQALEFLNHLRNFFPRATDRSFKILRTCQEGAIEEANQILDRMKQEGDFPSALIYSSLIVGLSKKGFLREAMEVMNEMIRLGYFPVSSTCNALIIGFCQQGEVEAAMRLMRDLKMRGCL